MFEDTTPVSSQTAFPGRATVRTVVQTVIAVVLTAGVVLPAAVAVLGEELAAVLPPAWLAWLVGAAATVAAIAAALTRIMAIPAVDAALRRFGLSSTPKA
ncbi:hypothetical protein ACFS27_03440 [Promicromonospora vindobonensis]|uniref:Holin n=1 Tax=Promicromonospora vindobonensis TaxID=195748 RepID=A0ABW5VQ88_9MICO